MKLTSRASIQIQKPIAYVYEGIVNPDFMTKYFISESNGHLETGVDLLWSFPEFDGKYPITKVKVEERKSISFVWDSETVVHIVLRSQPNNSTVVEVTEGSKVNNVQNLEWLISNTGGWANFLACMKAYLEHGIQLRKGAYDFLSKSE